ncbi:MAG: hypothetical protein MK008_05995 [Bdellovibrionales bacterium]|nr:hypothetical protein [Bdellovibrionales bacterium]
MTLIALLLLLNPIFANGISFTAEQCQRFKAEGITGGDYYINEALARDCKIQVPDSGGYFPPMVLNPNETHKKNCGMKNLALDGNNSGYFQDVVTFNNMHPDYFYPDRGDEYPFVFAIQVPGINGKYNVSNGVAVDVDSIPGCRKRIENILDKRLDNKNIILTTGHAFVRQGPNNICKPINNSEQKKSAVASGPDVSKFNFSSRINKIICTTKSCQDYSKDEYNDFCVVITSKRIEESTSYENINTIDPKQTTKLVAYQPTLVSSLKNSNIKKSERIISENRDPLIHKKYNNFSSTEKAIIHYSDTSAGASGGGLFTNHKSLIGIHISAGQFDKTQKVEKGIKGSKLVNYAIDPQIACQRLSSVLN